jgi:purine-cytosine permease-like protein
MATQETPVSERPKIEVRSIDYVPRKERHGKVWHQGPFWFAGNFVLMTLMIGFIGPSMKLSAFYSTIAILLGVGVGTLFMAFHANQGPTMGLPQMIQSRAQFGVKGVILPLTAVFFCYTGFNVFNTILATDAVQTVIDGEREPWYMVWIMASVLIAIVGHDLLHRFQRFLTYVIVAVYVLMTLAALVYLKADSALPEAGFTLDGFLVQLGAAAGYQISYSVYVSDYSRYLPHDTPTKKIILWTYSGAAISAVWMMSLGALIASAIPSPSAIGSLKDVGNQLIPGFGTFTVLISIPSVLGIMAVNFYGAMLTSITALDAFTKILPSLKNRVIGISGTALATLAITLAIPEQYMGAFNTFIIILLYSLIPWTAVNLVDFYFVRKGHYAISEIFNPKGIYGSWSKQGLTAYFIGIIAMIPFMALSFYVGPAAEALGGADITFVVGLVASGLAYLVITKASDLPDESRLIIESEAALEGAN